MSAVFSFKADAWFGYMNSVFVSSLFLIKKDYQILSHFIFLSYLGFVIFYLYTLKQYKYIKIVKIYLIGILILPTVSVSLFYYSRDNVAGLFTLTMSMILVYSFINRDSLNNNNLEFIDLISIILSYLVLALRDEGIALYLFFWAIYLIKLKLNKIKILKLIFSLSIILFIHFYLKLHLTPDYKKMENMKLLASLSHPIGAVISNSKAKISESELKTIDKYLDINKLKAHHYEADIVPFHKRAYEGRSFKDLSGLMSTFFSMVFKNPSIVLESRLKLFHYTFWGNYNLVIYRFFDIEKVETFINDFKLNTMFDDKKNSLASLIKNHLINFYRDQENKWLFTTYPQAVLLIFSILLFRRLPISGIFSSLFGLKIFIYFLFSPPAYFKYIFDIYLAGFLLIPILINEISDAAMRNRWGKIFRKKK